MPASVATAEGHESSPTVFKPGDVVDEIAAASAVWI